MRVLSLTSKKNAEFYTQQVAALRELGVEVTTVVVPGNRLASQANQGSRSARHYLEFVPTVIYKSLDDFDVVHANYGLTAPAALVQLRLPVVLSLWGTDLMGPFGKMTRAAARFCDEVVVMSERMATELSRPCHVVPHGVDLDRFEPMQQRAARRQVGWDESGHVVFFPYPKTRDVKNYPLASRVVAAADDILEGDVRLESVSGVSHEEMPYYYNAADALLLTSKREGSPNSVKEAMACNCPVISTDVGDVSERLAGVQQSSVCHSESELVARLVSTLRRDRQSNGREQIRDLSFERTGQRLKSIYELAAA